MKIVFFPALLGFILIEGAIGGPAAICDSTICARDPNSVLKDGPPTCAASAKGESPGCTFAECCESLCTPYNGLLNINAQGKGNVCCPDSCDACNYNVGCLQTGRPECCPWKIRKQMTGDICGEGDPAEDAPCNLPAPPTPAPPTPAPPTPAPTPPPDCSPFDGFLVTADGGVPVCCPIDCNGKCNFNEGCTEGDSSFEECCPFKIRDRAEDCGVVPVAPCVPVPTTPAPPTPAPPTPAPPTPAPPTPAPPTPTTPAQECFPGFPGVLDEDGEACCPLGMCQIGGVDTCGERGCGQLDGKAKNCCSTRILRDNNKCSSKGSAPCVA